MFVRENTIHMWQKTNTLSIHPPEFDEMLTTCRTIFMQKLFLSSCCGMGFLYSPGYGVAQDHECECLLVWWGPFPSEVVTSELRSRVLKEEQESQFSRVASSAKSPIARYSPQGGKC
jgi:hypothetical protein